MNAQVIGPLSGNEALNRVTMCHKRLLQGPKMESFLEIVLTGLTFFPRLIL